MRLLMLWRGSWLGDMHTVSVDKHVSFLLFDYRGLTKLCALQTGTGTGEWAMESKCKPPHRTNVPHPAFSAGLPATMSGFGRGLGWGVT